MVIDGTTFDVPDSEENDARLGRPKTHRGEWSAFSRVRVVALAECGTHAITHATLGPFSTAESVLARELFDVLGPEDLLMAERGFAGLERWRAAAASGADLLWRIKSTAVLPVWREPPGGSYLSDIAAAGDRKRADAVVARVIEYTLDDPGRPQYTTRYRLITTILDHESAPAMELAARYNERWEIETVLDELKTHQRGPAQVLRSRSPEGVEQEVWGHLLVHHAIRSLMHTAAPRTSARTLTGSPSPAPCASRDATSPRGWPFPLTA
ncbi:hypothetical protein ABH930_006735 [Kitasatospora sp. GAS204A]|nr:hypothetical protein [Kitasatospora sp. GAS204B]